MKKISKLKKQWGFIIPLIMIIGLFSYLGFTYVQPNSDELKHIEVEASFIADFTDLKQLVGAVDNVFVGRVITERETINTGGDTMPETRFSVEVLDNIKGNLTGEIIVNQEGGVRESDKAVVLFKNDELLIPNEAYLFATKTGKNGEWHTLVPGFGDILIEDITHKQTLINQFSEATKNQVLYDPDSK